MSLSDDSSTIDYDNIITDYYEAKPVEVPKEDIIVGIDLGTTNSCVAVWRNNKCEIIPDENGNHTIPSVVGFTNRSRYIGADANNQKEINSENVYYEVKRLIGRKYNDQCVQNDAELLSYKLDHDDNNNIMLKCNALDKLFSPEEISSMILSKLKIMAETYLDCKVTRAVITVPAYFTDAQRQATRDAASISGLNCVRIINEPTSAALAYGIMNTSINRTRGDQTANNQDKQDTESSMNVLVYDLGGGTLDVSLLRVSGGIFEVLASSGNTHIGGSDFDSKLINYCMNNFKRINNLDNLDDITCLSLQMLRKQCELAKKILSSCMKAYISVKSFHNNIDLLMSISREQYIALCSDLLILCLQPLNDIFEKNDDLAISKRDIDEVILVGGMTRMPAIRDNIRHYIGKEPTGNVNPDEVVAYGAAIQAYILGNRDDPFTNNVTLLDITPLSLGVETIGGIMSVIIPRGTPIPTQRRQKYSTDTDYSDTVLIKIFEGERTMTRDNFIVGEFILDNIKKAPRGIPKIEVNFNVDINGIITVTGEETDNHTKRQITITGNKGRLSKDQITDLIQQAQDYELRDKLERSKRYKYYEIDEICANVLININHEDFKIHIEDKTNIATHMESVKMWLSTKKYYEREEDELVEYYKNLKSKYGTLVLKYNKENTNFVSQDGKNAVNATSVFNDEEQDLETIKKQAEDRAMGIEYNPEEERNEIKRIRTDLIDLCNQLTGIITDTHIKLPVSDQTEFMDYLNDTILWIYTHDNPTCIDYKVKLDEINEYSNNVFTKYPDIMNDVRDDYSRSKLENSCYTLKIAIDNNMIPSHGELSSVLQHVEHVIAKLTDYDVAFYEARRTGEHCNVPELDYKEEILQINKMCDLIIAPTDKVNDKVNDSVIEE